MHRNESCCRTQMKNIFTKAFTLAHTKYKINASTGIVLFIHLFIFLKQFVECSHTIPFFTVKEKKIVYCVTNIHKYDKNCILYAQFIM